MKFLYSLIVATIAVAGVSSISSASPRSVISDSRYIGDGVLTVDIVSNGAPNDWNLELSKVTYEGKYF